MRRMMLLVGALVVAVVLVAAASGSAGSVQARWVIRDLGTLGGKSSQALASNDRGQVVGWSETRSGGRHAFLWQNGRTTDLGTFGRGMSEAVAINERGQIVGKSTTKTNGDPHGFLWEKGKMRDLGTPGRATWAVAINNRGQIIGGSNDADPSPNDVGGHPRVFLWQNGKMRDLGTLSKRDSSEAVAINERGEVIGVSYDNNFMPGIAVWLRAFVWRNGKLIDVGALPGRTSSAAHAINERGEVVGDSWFEKPSYGPATDVQERRRAFIRMNGRMRDLGVTAGDWSTASAINERRQVVGAWGVIASESDSESGTPDRHGFVWEDGRMISIGVLSGGEVSEAVAINERGQVIGSSGTIWWSHAFLWQNGKMTDLGTLPGGRDSYASTINNKGQIVGWATTKTGQEHAVLWSLRSG